MRVDLNIVNARIFIDGEILEGGISVEGGRIVKVGKEPSLPKASKVLDGGGLLHLPGLIDAHTHLRDLDFSYKEDFTSGSSAAAAGGFTTVLDMPNTKPPTDSAKRLREKAKRARSKILVNVGFYATLPSKRAEVKGLVGEGVVAFKLHLLHKWGDLDQGDDKALTSALSSARDAGRPVAVHAEDRALVQEAERRLKSIARGSPLDYQSAHSPSAEVAAVERILALAGPETPLHLCHLSTSTSAGLALAARGRGYRVSCEVTPHHLLLSEDQVDRFGGFALVQPPLRPALEGEMLRKLVAGGLIDVVASDHAPHAMEEKERTDVWECLPGFPGLETTLPLMLTLHSQGQISLGRIVDLLAVNPARIFHLAGRGRIAEGFAADLTVVDLKKRWKIDPTQFKSKARYSPFEGWEVKGGAVRTIVGGGVVMEGGEIVAEPGAGKVLGV